MCPFLYIEVTSLQPPCPREYPLKILFFLCFFRLVFYVFVLSDVLLFLLFPWGVFF